MAIVKANYVKRDKQQKARAKAHIRYIAHRPGRDGAKTQRQLFGSDGAMARTEAYEMIDAAGKDTVFFRFVLSPDPQSEDPERDVNLRDMTAQTMLALEQRVHKPVPYVAAAHDDHTPHRHVHILALVAGRLTGADFQALRESASQAAGGQRQERDLARQQLAREGEGGNWRANPVPALFCGGCVLRPHPCLLPAAKRLAYQPVRRPPGANLADYPPFR